MLGDASMTSRPRFIMLSWLVLAIGLLAAAGYLQGHLDSTASNLELVDSSDAVIKNSPEAAMLTMLPGGLRAPFVSYQWIRSQQLMQDGRYFDAFQRADWICAMQPKFPAVWDFQAWNMAWNISVMSRTPDERYKWINNGIELLRDRGIPTNPKSLMLYKQLTWIYYSKIGTNTDEYHRYYKQRLAAEMQRLLGAPPFAEADVVIAAFKPIAQAPLDRSVTPDVEKPIQADKLKELLQDSEVASYAALLANYGVKIDNTLLNKYNRFSNEDPAASVRRTPSMAETSEDKAVYALINDPSHASALAKMLAFVRAQLLWNKYRMDPQWMLHVMEKYKIPLDWRYAQAHALYWQTYGIDVCQSELRGDLDAVNSDRLVLYCMKDLTWYGKMTYIERPNNPDNPEIVSSTDIRYIDPAQDQAMAFINAVSKAQDVSVDQNAFGDGHRNYLVTCIQTLYACDRRQKAQELLDWINREYHLSGTIWDIKSLDDFVIASINLDGHPIPATAMTQISASLETAFVAAAAGDVQKFRNMYAYALKIYTIFSKQAVERTMIPPLENIAVSILTPLFIEPRTVGYNIPIGDLSTLYRVLGDTMPTLLPPVYDGMASQLSIKCQWQNINFDKAFPKPQGLDQYRRMRQQSMMPTTRPK
jgi:hypothetical protein